MNVTEVSNAVWSNPVKTKARKYFLSGRYFIPSQLEIVKLRSYRYQFCRKLRERNTSWSCLGWILRTVGSSVFSGFQKYSFIPWFSCNAVGSLKYGLRLDGEGGNRLISTSSTTAYLLFSVIPLFSWTLALSAYFMSSINRNEWSTQQYISLTKLNKVKEKQKIIAMVLNL